MMYFIQVHTAILGHILSVGISISLGSIGGGGSVLALPALVKTQ